MYVIIKFFGLLIVWNQWLLFRRKRYERGASEICKVGEKKCFIYFEKDYYLLDKKTVVCFPLKRSSKFKLHPENVIDRFFKKFGHSTELQVDDPAFDKRVYLESDALALAVEFGNNLRSREIILALFKAGALKIVADGAWIEVHLYGERRDIDQHAALLVELAEWLNNVPSKNYSLFRDPFLYKAATAEFLFGGLAFYGIVSLIKEFFAGSIIDMNILLSMTLKYSLLGFLILLPTVFFFFIGSSRGHKIIIENSLYIILGLPVACFFLLKDVNEANDDKESLAISAQVISRNYHSTSYYRRRSILGYSSAKYSLLVDLGDGHKKSISVSRNVYYENPSEISIEIGQGYYNQRYIKKINL